jgi:glucosamine--fructose-6-phosphate aminotransferase (isomerizing)
LRAPKVTPPKPPCRLRSASSFRSGYRQALLLLLGGLKRLEYRGYDSAGVGLVVASDKGPSIRVIKKKGKVKNLEDASREAGTASTVGIAHTRWATHGAANDVNAHPHMDEARTVAVVHNGIIENYQALKAALIAEG